jgi:hypothetical protein
MSLDYKHDGWLGFLIGSKLWVDFSANRKLSFEGAISQLIKTLEQLNIRPTRSTQHMFNQAYPQQPAPIQPSIQINQYQTIYADPAQIQPCQYAMHQPVIDGALNPVQIQPQMHQYQYSMAQQQPGVVDGYLNTPQSVQQMQYSVYQQPDSDRFTNTIETQPQVFQYQYAVQQ